MRHSLAFILSFFVLVQNNDKSPFVNPAYSSIHKALRILSCTSYLYISKTYFVKVKGCIKIP